MAQLPIPVIVLRAINHVIGAEKWAHDLLRRREQQVIRLVTPFAEFEVIIQNGLFANHSDQSRPPAVSLDVSQEAVWAFLKDGKAGAMRFVRISGDVDFAADLNRLVADLQWEVEEDLAQFIGDAPARRIVVETQKFVQQTNFAAKDLQVGMRDFLVHERGVLLGKEQFTDFKAQIRSLRDQLDRTEKKVSYIELAVLSKEK